MNEKRIEKAKKRTHLSLNLDAYPDVAEMLEAAIEATGETVTQIIIRALREEMPGIVERLAQERVASALKFRQRFSAATTTERLQRAAHPESSSKK